MAFAILIEVDGHGLGHNVSIEAHFKWKVAWVGIASGSSWPVGGNTGVVDDLLAVEPCADQAVWVWSEAYLEAEVEPLTTEITLLMVDLDAARTGGRLRDQQAAAKLLKSLVYLR